MAKTGRPRKQIDKAEFEKLCGMQCSCEEIADWFECSVDTVERWCKRTYKTTFAEVFSVKRGKGKIALRRAQFELAKKYPAMAIFLGKQYLGQKDKFSDGGAFANGQLADLIDGMKEPLVYDIYAETESTDGTVEDEQAKENQPT